MKQLLLCLFITSFAISSYSQRNLWSETEGAFNDFYYREFYQGHYNKKQILEHKIKETTSTTHHKRSSFSRTMTFDEDGRLIKSENKGRKYHSLGTFEYDKNGRMIRTEYQTPKGKIVEHFSYDSQGRQVKFEHIGVKGKSTIYTTKFTSRGDIAERRRFFPNGKFIGHVYQYDASRNLTSHKVYNEKDLGNPTHMLEYTYWENGSKKTTTYTEKGKVKYVWNFDCKPEGELLGVKKKDESTICILEEFDANGNRVVWKREFNEKGSLVKTKTVYGPDSTALDRMIYTSEDRLIYEYHTLGDGSKYRVSYDKKGNVFYRTEWLYNKENQLVKEIRSDRKGTTQMKIYSYEGGLETAEVRVYKRNTYVKETEYKFY